MSNYLKVILLLTITNIVNITNINSSTNTNQTDTEPSVLLNTQQEQKTGESLAPMEIFKLSFDNNFVNKLSRDVINNATFSFASMGNKLTNPLIRSDNLTMQLLGFVPTFLGMHLASVANHELGHVSMAQELGFEVVDIDINFFHGSISYFADEDVINSDHYIPKTTAVSLAGMRNNRSLANKIADFIVKDGRKIQFDFMNFLYIQSKLDQKNYIYFSKHFDSIRNSDGNDVMNYIKYNNIMYGKDSMTLDRLYDHSWLDLCDPIMWTAFVSFVTNTSLDLPRIYINDKIALTPFAESVMTPFSTVEAKFGAYLFTDFSPMKVSFSYGKQDKSREAYLSNIDCDILNDFKYSIPRKNRFTGLKEGEEVVNESTYAFELSIYDLFRHNNTQFGLEAAIWSQPKFFSNNAYNEKSKLGGMMIFNVTHHVTERDRVTFH